MDLLTQIFLSKTRAGIFKSLFLNENNEHYFRELERLTGIGLKSLQIEIKRLASMDLLLERKDGNRTYVRANIHHPLFSDFKSIVNKLYGPEVLLKKLLNDQFDIEFAFIFGSFAKGDQHARSDIDIFIIGDISSQKLSDLLYEEGQKISFEINDHKYSKNAFLSEINSEKHFIMALQETEKIFLKGNELEFRKLYSKKK